MSNLREEGYLKLFLGRNVQFSRRKLYLEVLSNLSKKYYLKLFFGEYFQS